MTATTSVHSNAFNFMSSVKNGVDPRTGLYSVSISLPEIQTNDLRGPGFGLAMAYNPMNEINSGYGQGWNLQLSQYTPGNQILSLSTGETFKVTGTNGDQLFMKEKKLDSFHFYQEDETRYRVMHKSGMVEILKVLGSSQNSVALPIEIYSPAGHKIILDYKQFSGTHLTLSSVKDDSGQTLLMVNPTDTSVEVLLQPYAGPDGGPLARFVMTLEGSDRYVSKITLPTENEASWRFGYRLKNNHLCISSVETPAGSREVIEYQDLGHRFPGNSNREPLPRVTRHLIDPGSGQATIDVRYTYKNDNFEEPNFLGYGLSAPWTEDGLDYLYKHIGKYEYVCVESLWVDNLRVREIQRTFNQFHLMTQEKTTQNNNVQTVETLYHLTPDVPFEQQPSYCQLPKEVNTTWTQLDNPNRWRRETVNTTYDTYGNLLKKTFDNGVVETSTWYPAEGAEGCPPDPEGFVRQRKDHTVTPVASTNGNAPTLRTIYRYKALPALAGSGLQNWLPAERETLVQLEDDKETELQCTVFEHTNDPSNGFLHGRVDRQTVTMNGKSTIVDYQYDRFESPQLGVHVQQTTETLRTDFDDVRRTVLRQHSLITSQLLLSLFDGLENRFEYDALNRPTREIVAYGTDYEASFRTEYTLSANRDEHPEHLTINAKGVRTRTVLDGLGRVTFQERDHVDSNSPNRYRQTYEAVYNAWGHLIEETEYDWLDGKKMALTSRFNYDDWNQQSSITGPDGVEAHQHTDPIGTEEQKGPITRSWQQSAGSAPTIVGKSETWQNKFGKPTRVRVLNAADEEVSVETFLYDGLGRCTEQSDVNKHITQFTYDPWSRLVNSTLPDTSIVKYEYAEHSSSDLTVTLSVTHNGITHKVGEQAFDGLERLSWVKSGQRVERYLYEEGKTQVAEKITPANDSIKYEYNRLLTDQPIASQAPDEIASFSYHPTSARLTRTNNEQGTREYGYNAANQLTEERWEDKHGKTWETLYSDSMQGRQTKRTDLKQAGTDGLDTVHHYDDFGRVKNIDQGSLQASFEYDNLGRPSRTTTRDRVTASQLVTELEYDDQNREILRTLHLNQQTPRTQQQTWRLDGLLESRHLQQGATSLLNETFEYDNRGRLSKHSCSGSTLPRNTEGKEFISQLFIFDSLDNITLTITTFPDMTTERAVFTYATDDPCQLKSITYRPERLTGNPTFTYNLNGCQLNDERGQRLHYDSQNRLLSVKDTQDKPVSYYLYDSHDHLINSQQGTQSETLRFYEGEQLSNIVQDDKQTQFLYHSDQPLGQQLAADSSQTLLLLTDANHSVLGESQQSDLRTAVYSAYGERHSDDEMQSLLAFNGEVLDSANGWYLLGRGYRAYNPCLMRFHSPDSLSPFGSGGVNPYTYCLGNPIALRDPTGHSSVGYSGRLRRPDEDVVPGLPQGGGGIEAWIGVVMGAIFVAVGAIATIVTFGTAAPLTAIIITKGVLLGLGTFLSAGSTVASGLAAANRDEYAGKWGMYLGIASIIPSAGSFAFAKVSSMIAAKAASSAWKEMVRDIPRYLATLKAGAGAGASSISSTSTSASTSLSLSLSAVAIGFRLPRVRAPLFHPKLKIGNPAPKFVPPSMPAPSGGGALPTATELTNQLAKLKPLTPDQQKLSVLDELNQALQTYHNSDRTGVKQAVESAKGAPPATSLLEGSGFAPRNK
jgi:RHS repeat-associated protein